MKKSELKSLIKEVLSEGNIIPKLKYQTKTVYEVYYSDFDKFVNSFYNIKRYEIVASEEKNNDTMVVASALKKQALDKYDDEQLRKFIDSDGLTLFMIHTIVQDLVNKDAIPPGNYNIWISW